jgi:hypothetical protein
VQLLGIAGGAGAGDEDALGCCFVFPLLPLVAFFACLAVYRNATLPAIVALVLAGLPYLALRGMVAGYQPSDDWEVMAEQATGRKLIGSYQWLVAVAGLSLAYIGCRRLVSWGWSRRTRRCF